MEEEIKEEDAVVEENAEQPQEEQQDQAQTTQDLTQVLANQEAIMLAIQNLATLVLNADNKKEEVAPNGDQYSI